MSDAPALPAQTPGMFVGGGGSGSSLTGECAAAVADAGLSDADFGTLEVVTESVEAAAGRCQAYRQARFLDEAERAFSPDSVGRSADEDERARLMRRPTARQRHLDLCVAAPLLDARFFRTEPSDPSTNARAGRRGAPPGAAGYDPLRALAAPLYQGPTMNTARLAVISKLDAPLVETPPGELTRRRAEGEPLSQADTTTALRGAIRGALVAAASEDAPRLRSVALAECRRPRQDEAAQREAVRARPEPPATADTAQPAVSGVDPDESGGADAPDSDTGHSAAGCVEAQASSSVAAMREEVQAEHASAEVESADEVEQADLTARRTATRALVNCRAADEAARDSEPGTMEGALAEVSRRSAAAALGAALAARERASARRAAHPAMGEQALLLQREGQVGSPAISGHVPRLATPLQSPQAPRRVAGADDE